MTATLLDLAKKTVAEAQRRGAADAAVAVSRRRFIELRQRDGKLERIQESASSALSLDVYADERFSSHSTSDLRPEALERFTEKAVAMTRLVGRDPHRRLTDPKLYEGRPTGDLELYDSGYDAVDTAARHAAVEAVEAAARAADGPILSVTARAHDSVAERVQVHSNGFEDGERTTQFWLGATVTAADEGDRKPEDGHWVGARHRGDLDAPEAVGREAARRALARRGQVTLPSGSMTLVFENRAAPSLLRHFLSAADGEALQQERSFLADRLDQPVGSAAFTLVDDPTIPRALGSRRFDGEGISAARRTLVDAGVLRGFLIDVYYGSKLGRPATGGSGSNIVIAPGERGAEEIVAGLERAVLVTGLLGGNSDPATGDFSHGLIGFEIVEGEVGRPVGEMNLTGSHAELWHRLGEAGNDPYVWSPYRLPTLVFDAVSVSGT